MEKYGDNVDCMILGVVLCANVFLFPYRDCGLEKIADSRDKIVDEVVFGIENGIEMIKIKYQKMLDE